MFEDLSSSIGSVIASSLINASLLVSFSNLPYTDLLSFLLSHSL
jgi:hypothetical protein